MANYVLNDDKMFADVTDGIAIVINSETGIYYGMNGFGTLVFDNLRNGVSAEDLLSTIKAMDGVPSDIESKFNEFVKSMLDRELIVEAPSGSAKVEISAEVAKEDNFVMDVQEYNDAQELLLADPIHEVKEETGWTPEKESIGYSKEETVERESKLER